MKITHDIAAAHARALSRNYRVAWPAASASSVGDYVATHMVGDRQNGITGFLDCAPVAQDVADDYGSWYAHTIVNL